MAGMRTPQIPEVPVPVLTEDQLRRLLNACDGRDFASRRDAAIIRLLVDTGLRRGECAGIMLDDLDLDDQVVTVLGKGRRPRVLAYGRKTALALDRYLRARAGHPHAALPNLWVGRNGAMTPSGVFQVVADRGASVGLPGLHPHRLRHSFAASLLALAVPSATSCGWLAGSPARWWIGTPRPPPSSAPAPRTLGSASATGSRQVPLGGKARGRARLGRGCAPARQVSGSDPASAVV
jgi:integrase